MLRNRPDWDSTIKMGFSSRDSYVSFAGHVYVSGEGDHAYMRTLIYERAEGMCQTCAKPHWVSWLKGEWSHPKAFGGKRCDGPCCGKWSCHAGHEAKHKRKF